MSALIALIGRPNVGKSTLFNSLTQSRRALVADFPGLTRDRLYGQGKLGELPYWVVDTGGIVEAADPEMSQLTDQQAQLAIEEADCIFFLVDCKAGLTSHDQQIATRLRPYKNKVILVVNKADRLSSAEACGEFYELGFSDVYAIAAREQQGVYELITEVLPRFAKPEEPVPREPGIAVAMLGRPNVGKSTLINRILGEERVVVFDAPGTTRDSIYIPFETRGRRYTLIDTAGVRRRARVSDAIEKFSYLKTFEAIKHAHVVVVVLNARENVSDQDMRLIGMVLELGRALVLVFNQWDKVDKEQRAEFTRSVDRRLPFTSFAQQFPISALEGTGINRLWLAINEAYDSASKEITTGQLNRALEKALETHQPPMIKGRRIKLRYAVITHHHPMIILIQGKQLEALPDSYRRFLAGFFCKYFKLVGVPLQIEFKSDENPYAENL